MAFIIELFKIICLFILIIAMIVILIGFGLCIYSFWLDIVEEHDLDKKE